MSALINTKTIKELNNNNFTIASSYITLAFIHILIKEFRDLKEE